MRVVQSVQEQTASFCDVGGVLVFLAGILIGSAQIIVFRWLPETAKKLLKTSVDKGSFVSENSLFRRVTAAAEERQLLQITLTAYQVSQGECSGDRRMPRLETLLV